MWLTVHSQFDFYVYPAVGGEFFFKVVVGDNVLWEVAEFEAHVFAMGHGCVQIKIFDVDCHELYIGRGGDAVEEYFDGEKLDSGGSTVAQVIYWVASYCEACAIRIRFFWFVVHYYLAVGDVAPSIGRYFFFGDEKDCVGAFSKTWHTSFQVANLLGV